MAALTSALTQGDLIKQEEDPTYCREVVTLLAGTDYPLGAILGKITSGGKYTLSANAEVSGKEGAETATAVLVEARDATDGDLPAVVVARGRVVLSKAALSYDASVNDATKQAAKWAQLRAVGLVVRDSA